ncbi:MAG: gluconate transporter [Bacteroidetes bacterium]|nr:MAG: gluconate transporter [Bacteroidota bacterium]
METTLLLAVVAAVAVLLFLILVFRIQAFIALLISSIVVGVIAGMPFLDIVQNIQKGMGDTLGYVATVVGLGAIFGAILEHSGATESISGWLLDRFGIRRAPAALSIAGFLIAIPVFFDVAFVILAPLLYGLQKKTGKSLLYFALPLATGLAVTHAFIPPTPGPIAVAEIIGVPLGWIILFGVLVGFPTTIIAGLIYGRFVARKIHIETPAEMAAAAVESRRGKLPVGLILTLILTPVLLILANTLTDLFIKKNILDPGWLPDLIRFLGHPFIALIISTLLAWYFLGIRYGLTRGQLLDVSTRALGPAGVIILITGAGGVFKQMLVETGAGVLFAQKLMAFHIAPVLLAFLLAMIIRLLQGSATVAMITAAGILAPILENIHLTDPHLALLTLSIAAGATSFSHLNDSGFWLINRYLGMTEMQTLRSWTTVTTVLGFTALCFILIMSIWV